MEKTKTDRLLQKYLNNDCTAEERAWVESWYLNVANQSPGPEAQIDFQAKEAEIWQKLQSHHIPQVSVIKLWQRRIAAAAVLLFVSAAGFYFLKSDYPSQEELNRQTENFKPAGNHAVLTLANGSSVILNTAQSGKISMQGAVAVTKTAEGNLVYQSAQGGNDTAHDLYNTLVTPKGGQYRLTLEDGTRVMLNAESSLRFPASFKGPKRIVELTGEAYFEVVHNEKVPFSVKTGRQMVEDVGTHFNIRSYKEDPAIVTTLLEGAVSVSSAPGNSVLNLKPGQQSKFNNGNLLLVPDADIDLATGWIDGHFRFRDASIQEVMRELSRWYDFEVIYEGATSQDRFTGNLHRNIKASQALEILSFFKVHYSVSGKKIIITS